MNTERRIEILLLLELISERLMHHKPERPENLGEPATEHYRGYYEGWWDCLQQLQDIITNHNEGNGLRR